MKREHVIRPGDWFELPYSNRPLVRAVRESPVKGHWITADAHGHLLPSYTYLGACKRVQAPNNPLRTRQPTRKLAEPWPFRESTVPGRGLVRNIPAPDAVRRIPDKKRGS